MDTRPTVDLESSGYVYMGNGCESIESWQVISMVGVKTITFFFPASMIPFYSTILCFPLKSICTYLFR